MKNITEEIKYIRDWHIQTFNESAIEHESEHRAMVAPEGEYIDGKHVDIIIHVNGVVESKWHVIGWVDGEEFAKVIKL